MWQCVFADGGKQARQASELLAVGGQGNDPADEAAGEVHQRQQLGHGVAAAEIAGAIFNHKDNKKGHHDVFRFWWWEHVGTPFTFLTHPTIASSHIVMQLQLCFYTGMSSLNF